VTAIPPLPTAIAVRRWAVIGAAGLSGVLVVVSMLVDPVPSATGRELIEGYAENGFRAGLHTNLIHYGFALIAPVVYAIVGLVRGRGAALANAAGVFAVIGLSTLPGLVLLDLTSTAAARATDGDTAFAIEEQLGQMPAFVLVLIPAMVCAMLALPVAVAALWRARLVAGPVVVVALAAQLAPFFVPWYLGFGAQMLWMIGLAYLLSRLPLSLWAGGSPEQVVPAREVATAAD
jgi:hypothetical protein